MIQSTPIRNNRFIGISHADFKDLLRTPYHYDEQENIVDEDFIETYFDIKKISVAQK